MKLLAEMVAGFAIVATMVMALNALHVYEMTTTIV